MGSVVGQCYVAAGDVDFDIVSRCDHSCSHSIPWPSFFSMQSLALAQCLLKGSLRLRLIGKTVARFFLTAISKVDIALKATKGWRPTCRGSEADPAPPLPSAGVLLVEFSGRPPFAYRTSVFGPAKCEFGLATVSALRATCYQAFSGALAPTARRVSTIASVNPN